MSRDERFSARAELSAEGGFCEPLELPSFASADYECVHGRLPGDRTPACGCYPSEFTAAQLEQLRGGVLDALTVPA